MTGATGNKPLFLSQKSWQKRRGAKYNTPWFGTFGTKKTCFGRVFKMTADLSLSIVDFFPFIFPFNHIGFSIVFIWNMSQKKNNGRAFTIDLGDVDEKDDFQSNDDFENMETVHNLTLADLLGQSNRRREENYNFTIDLDDADDDIDF